MEFEKYEPPFTITNEILSLATSITEKLGNLSPITDLRKQPLLRRANRLKSIHSSCAIEGNTLTLDQVSDVVSGKIVVAPKKEIDEIKNANEAYKLLESIDPYKIDDILKAHKIMMEGLIDDAGHFRSGGVGVFKGNVAVHIGPPSQNVPILMEQLLSWVKQSDVHELIKYCVFHYEFGYIHPFSDGNGRMVRFLQSALLSKWKPIFAWTPIETVVKERQQEYYNTYEECNAAGSSTAFIVYMLKAISDSLDTLIVDCKKYITNVTPQVQKLLDIIEYIPMSAKQIAEKLRLKSSAGLKRNYLDKAIELGFVKMTEPANPNSRMQRYYKA
jgi:Fic family protein